MFTGIIESVGTVSGTRARGGGLEIGISAVFDREPLQIGESVAVSGPCLTVEKVVDGGFVVFASPETVRLTTASSLQRGLRVNLERALPVGGRFGGHIVTGHIDGVGRLLSVVSAGEATELRFDALPAVSRFLAAKGSIAIDGVSLTLNAVSGGSFTVMVIPHTLSATTLGGLRPGARVNLEADIIARYVSSLRQEGGGITEESLHEMGW